MAVIRWTGGDPLSPASWQKSTQPLLSTAPHEGNGPYGPGHGSFFMLGEALVCTYHAIDDLRKGWDSRRARVQRIIFREGVPYMGYYIGREVKKFDELSFPAIQARTASSPSVGCCGIGTLLRSKVQRDRTV